MEQVAREVSAEAQGEGSVAIVVVSPPKSEKDAALGLHVFTADAEARPASGVDAMCAYHALREEEGDRPVDAAELRFGDHAVAVVGRHDDVHGVEVDLGKPGLDAKGSGVATDRIEVVDGTHTFEIPLGASGDSTIVTLVRLVGLHAVAFTDDLSAVDLPALGAALKDLGAPGDAISVHAVKIEEPGWLSVRTWDPLDGVGEASGFGLGAICAAGVTMCCTVAENAVRCSEGELSAGWDGDGHVRLRGRVYDTAVHAQ